MNEQDRVTQTIDRLIDNLPQTIEILKGRNWHILARQLQDDLDNLQFWQGDGGLVKKERSEMWRKQASEYKAQHEKASSAIARLRCSN